MAANLTQSNLPESTTRDSFRLEHPLRKIEIAKGNGIEALDRFAWVKRDFYEQVGKNASLRRMLGLAVTSSNELSISVTRST